MTIVELSYFPVAVLYEARVSWEITSQLISAGQTATGVTLTARLDGGGAWKATLEELNLISDTARRCFRSVSAICDGGFSPIVLPMRHLGDVPYKIVSGAPLTRYADILHTSNVPFSSGVGYQVGTVDATLAEAAAMNATALTIAIAYGGSLQGGEHFSIDHAGMRHRLYRIRTVKDNGDGTWDVTVRPSLRGDCAAGQRVEFDQPKCVMKLASGNAMDAAFEGIGIARPSVSFIEAFPPFPVP